MTEQRTSIEFEVDGLTIAALAASPAQGPVPNPVKPLIAALHGGTYMSRYFDVAGSSEGSFMDVAAASGYQVVSFDRPGYGGSSDLAPADNTFGRHVELLAPAIAQAVKQFAATSVLLVGHSIGGMIALMIAAADTGLPLVGVSATGMGAVIPEGGAAQALGSLPPDQTVDLPYDQRDQVMFGPEFTRSPAAVERAHGSYAPVPVSELVQAPRWPVEHLPGLAPRVRVPVHNALAEFDALWDSSPANVARFAALFTAVPFIDASVARATGHSIDHHILGHALHLRQLAFADECAMWARQEGSGS